MNTIVLRIKVVLPTGSAKSLKTATRGKSVLRRLKDDQTVLAIHVRSEADEVNLTVAPWRAHISKSDLTRQVG